MRGARRGWGAAWLGLLLPALASAQGFEDPGFDRAFDPEAPAGEGEGPAAEAPPGEEPPSAAPTGERAFHRTTAGGEHLGARRSIDVTADLHAKRPAEGVDGHRRLIVGQIMIGFAESRFVGHMDLAVSMDALS